MFHHYPTISKRELIAFNFVVSSSRLVCLSVFNCFEWACQDF